MPAKRKPIEAHIAEGTQRDDRQPMVPLLVGGRGKLRRPRAAGRDVSAAFRELEQILDSVLDVADAPLVEAGAVMLARARAAGRAVREQGVLVEVRRVGRDGSELVRQEVNPAVQLERQSLQVFRLICEQLGVGPSARARLAAAGVEGRRADQEIDELAKIRAARRQA